MGAHRIFWDKQSRTKQVKDIHGIFSLLGNTVPASGTYGLLNGDGFDPTAPITRTGTGVFVVKLESLYPLLVCADCQLEVALGGAVVGAIITASDKTSAGCQNITVTLVNSSFAATDLANSVQAYLHLTASVKNTGVNR